MLQTLDFSRVKVNAFVVETDDSDKQKDAQIDGLLMHAGFKLVHKVPGRNSFYVHSSFRPSAKRG